MRNAAQLASTARIDQLMSEIERYLEAIKVFRDLGHEPRWQPEMPSGLVVRVREWLDARESQMSGV